MLPSAALLLLLVTATPWLAEGACDNGYTDVNDRCYKFVKDKREFADAQKYCENEGGNLAWLGDYSTTIDVLDNVDLEKDFWIGARIRGYLPGGSGSHSHYHSGDGRRGSGSGEDIDYSTLDIIRESDGAEYPLDQVGFWGKGQPKLKRDYGCVMVKQKKGKKGRHGEEKGLEWELKKCKDKKYFLCELKCDAGEVLCDDGSCAEDSSECGEIPPPVLSCNLEHDFSVDSNTFRSSGYIDGIYPANSVCVYKLYTTSDYFLKLKFDVFELGRDNQDFIEIYIGSLDLSSAIFFGRFSNSDDLEGRFVFSYNNRMVIVFRTDGRTGKDGRGFSITNFPFSIPESRFDVYITVTVSDGLRWIESPGYNDNNGELPGYTATWYFTAQIFTQLVFELDENSVLDIGSSLEIWNLVDGEEPVLIIRFIGGEVLSFSSFISTIHTCSVIYRTGPGQHWNARGFKLSYVISTAVECKQEFTSLAGSLTSPGFNTTLSGEAIPYPLNYECTYEIKMPDSGPFTFWFDGTFGIDIDDSLVIDTPGVTTNSDLTITEYTTTSPSGQFPALSLISVTFSTDPVTANKGIAGFKIYFSRNCPDLIVTQWTILSDSSPYIYDDTVQISCIPGYEFQDNGLMGNVASVSCGWAGVWSAIRIPDCEPVFCGAPPMITGGYVSQSTGVLFGDQASYECFDGRVIIGLNQVNCTASKNWTEPPSCSSLYCVMEQPTDGISSHVLREGSAAPINSTWYGFRAVVELQCADGYYVQGVKSIVCEGEDGWSSELGTCEKEVCFYQPVKDGIMSIYTREELPTNTAGDVDYWTELLEDFFATYSNIPNVGLLPSIPFGDMLYIHCRTGFVVEGSQNVSTKATCSLEGLFDDIPDCVDSNECNSSPCEQTCVDTPGSFYCDCDPRYTLDSDGVNCTLIPGCDEHPNACDQMCTSVDLPQWFVCSCEPPYVLYDRLGSNGYKKHPADTYSPQLRVNQSCVLPQCPLQDIVMKFNDKTELLGQYNDTAYPFYYNDTVEVLCEVGYTFPDGDLRKKFHCGVVNMDLGWFDSDNNSLADIMCSKEATCTGTMITETVNYTTAYQQVCSTPFAYEIVSTCDLDPEAGVYILSPDVICPVVDCGDPQNMQTLGSVNLTYDCTTLGCSFEFTCDDGSKPLPLNVPTTVMCMENGKWNYSNIYCDGTTCDDPGMVVGTQRYATEEMLSNITFSLANLKSGGRVYYKCIKEGYELFNSLGERVNSTYCNGISFSPPVDDFVCIDTQSPTVPYCPSQVEVFRFSTFDGAPFDQGEFLGYPSPAFEDNGGIQSIEVQPPFFSLEHIFYLDSRSVVFNATDFEGNPPASCSIEFIAVDVVTPVLNCSDLIVELNATHLEVEVTADMVLSVVQIDDSDAHQTIFVEFSSSSNNIDPDIVKFKINQNARITVERVFFAGDVNLGTNRENITVSSHCSVPIIPKPDLCAEVFAPTPADASMVCTELPSGGRECNYTCNNPEAVFFEFSSNLNNTASSQCTDPELGFSPVYDCIVTDYANAYAGHTIIIGDGQNYQYSLSCFEKFLEGYRSWTITQVCNNSVADVLFSQVPAGPETPLSILLNYNSGAGQFSGFPQWNIIPKDGMWGTEVICNYGVPEIRNIQLQPERKAVNLTGMDACLQPTFFFFSIIQEVTYACADVNLSPIQTGEVEFEGNMYPIYSCFECPAGTYASDGECKACPIGQFQSSSGVQTSCTMCPPGTVTIENGQSSCLFECPSGYYGENGVYPCRPCPKNSYSLNTSYCEECPVDTKGFLNAQSSNDSCRPVCEAGYYSETGFAPADGNCTACPVNFISTTQMSTSCQACGTNEYTNGLVGLTSCIKSSFCAPGQCANGRCDGYHGRFYCTQGCGEGWQGIYCDEPIDNCDSMACDPRGTSSCMNGLCNCNTDIAMGTLCDNITVSCDGVDCENGGKCFITTVGKGPAADLLPICLCGPEWSGDDCTTVEDKCVTAGCVNSQCINEDVRARCDCDLGWQGLICDTDIDGCMSSPCHNGGNCTDVSGSAVTTDAYAYTCSCPVGFSGDQCEVRENECNVVSCGDFAFCLDDYSSINSVFCINIYFNIYVNILISISTPSFCQALDIKCENGGVCIDDPVYKFRCQCPDSGIYGGLYCQARIDFCADKPCGLGNCTNKEDAAGYECECNEGYMFDGDSCVNKDECDEDADICNNGNCKDSIGSYYCDCYPGYAGKNCDTIINQCLLTTCYGNGTCQPDGVGFNCLCAEGRTGKLCEDEVSLCNDQCLNGATCIDAFNDYTCLCEYPAYGTHCEFLPDPCDEKPCSFGGNCTASGQYFTCECSAGHAGTTCETWIDECSDNPCGDGGVCQLNYGSGFTCKCHDGYAGDLCEEKLDPCDPDPCHTKATCIRQGFTQFTCVCPAGFVGDSCETPIDSNFDCYLKVGDVIQVLKPTLSESWSTSKFTLSAWIRPDRIFDDDDNFIEIIQITVEGQVLLSFTACGVIFNGAWYNYSNSADAFLDVGEWSFVGVSVEGSSISVYQSGLVIEYNLGGVPAERLGRLNVIISPQKNFVGFCSQVYLWAGASFPRSQGSQLNALLNTGVGQLPNLEELAGSFIHYYWNIGLYLLSPFCEVGRPSSYCVDDCEGKDNKGTYLEFERGCPDDIIVTTSSRSVAVDFDPPIFLANGEEITSDIGTVTSNISPGDELRVGKHKVTYKASVNKKKLFCKFNIYVRYGCDGVVYKRRCIRPHQQTSLTYARANARCANFGGELMIVQSQDEIDKVVAAIINTKLYDQQFMVEYFHGSAERPVCVSVSNAGVYSLSSCTQAVAAICGRTISGGEACALPNFNDQSVSVDLISSAKSRFSKYALTCTAANEVLPSYIPKYITCYPEGNWDTIVGLIPDCVTPAPSRFRFRFKLRIRFRIRIKSRCITGSKYIFQNIFQALENVLNSLNKKWSGGLLNLNNSPKKCCNDKDNCAQLSSECESEPYAYRTSCQASVFGRRKRQADELNDVDIGLNLDELPETLNSGGVSLSPEEVITQAVAANEFVDALNNQSIIAEAADNADPLEDFGAVNELDCAEGYENLDDTECSPCGPGTYWTANGTCDFCPLDTFQPNSTQTRCEDCDTSTPITYFVGSTSANDCKAVAVAGQFYNSLTGTIETCPIATYQPDDNQLSCIACDPGLTTVSSGSNSSAQCINICPSGEQTGNSGGCVPCEVGFYRDAAADPVCMPCPTGYYTASEGSVSLNNCSIVDCGIGEYRNVTVNICMNCSRGEYQNSERQESCIPCGDNFTTNDIRSTLKSDCIFICPSGYEQMGSKESCTECAAGTYREKNESDPSDRCQSCSTQYFTTPSTAAVSESDCTVLQCPPGMEASPNNSTCVLCPNNTFSPDTTYAGGMCQACKADYITLAEGATNEDNCTLDCPDAGKETGKDNCTFCKQGFYAVEGQQSCVACNPQLTTGVLRWDTVGEGSVAEANCSVAFCKAGYYKNIAGGVEECVACPVGEYQKVDNTRVDKCEKCPLTASNTSQTTTSNASISVTDCRVTCPKGEEDIGDSCEECAVGYFKEMGGPTPCEKCSDGFTTSSTGSINESDNCTVAVCEAGEYSEAKVCMECAIGFYQELANFTGSECEECKPVNAYNTTTSGTGATKADQCQVVCPAGYIPHATKGCEICPKDTYDDGDMCTPCNGFTTNNMTGGVNASACTHKICVPGEENDATDSKQCRTCPENTYSVDGTKCVPCGGGKITKSTGAKGSAECILDCLDGTEYSDRSGICEPCSKGQYRVRADGLFDCSICPADNTTVGEGSSSCPVPVCSSGKYAQESAGVYTCTDCPLNTYQVSTGSLSCINCGPNTYTNITGSSKEGDCLPIPTCDNSPCPHEKHICADTDDGRECTCYSAYDAISSSSCRHVCARDVSERFCANDGICNEQVDDISLVCTCRSGYEGVNCTEFTDAIDKQSENVLIIVGVVAGVVLIAAVVGGIVAFTKGAASVASAKMAGYAVATNTPAQAMRAPNHAIDNQFEMRDMNSIGYNRGSPLHSNRNSRGYYIQ